MSKSIKPADLGAAIAQELSTYSAEVQERVNAAGDKAIKDLLKATKAKAPVASGDFKKSLATKAVDDGHGLRKYVLYARAPQHRIFHLLVHGHAKQNGGRVPGDPFLQDAVDQVLPNYEKDVEEAVKA